jgi:hypothetical protein
MTEYGVSEQFPDIRWQTTVESFYEPQTSGMWVRGVCLAEYTDLTGQTQTVELTQWLTELDEDQMKQLTQRNAMQKQSLARYIIETEELAAQYAGVSVETIQQWVKNGMLMTDGAYLEPWLDTYLRTDGKPTAQDKQDTITMYPGLASVTQNKTVPGRQTTPESGVSPGSGSPGANVELPDGIDPELKEEPEQ